MKATATLQIENDTAFVKGELDFDSVVFLAREGDAWLSGPAPGRCQFDLSQVTRANSAGTALLLNWLRVAGLVNKQLQIVGVPEGLRSLMNLGGVESLLPTEPSPPGAG